MTLPAISAISWQASSLGCAGAELIAGFAYRRGRHDETQSGCTLSSLAFRRRAPFDFSGQELHDRFLAERSEVPTRTSKKTSDLLGCWAFLPTQIPSSVYALVSRNANRAGTVPPLFRVVRYHANTLFL